MATMTFSVPEAVKRDFDVTFEGQDKGAILSRLMREAVSDVARQKRRAEVVKRLLDLHETAPRMSAAAIDKVRRLGRP